MQRVNDIYITYNVSLRAHCQRQNSFFRTTAAGAMASKCVRCVVMLRFWFFHLDSISIQFFTKNSMSIRFRFQFFRQEISYTSPINLGAAMLNYSVKAGEAGDDSERSGSYMTP